MNGERFLGYYQLLRQYPGYRRLYAAHTLSLLGDWFNLVAIMLLLTRLTGSSAQSIGFVLVLKLLPIFLLGPVAGVVVDRVSRKAVMVMADVLRCGVVLCFLLVWVYPEPAIIYIVTAVQIGISAFFEPARSASVPNLVPREKLATANALGALTWSAMFTLGAALGGVFTQYLGWQAAIVLDAATYAASALLLLGMHMPRRQSKPGRPTLVQLTGVPDFLEGMRYLWNHRRVAAVVAVKASWGITGSLTLLLTLFGEREYSLGGRTALSISILYTARAIGTGLGPILAQWITRSRPAAMRRIIGWCFLWGGAWYLVFASVHNLALAVICVIVAHLGGSTTWVFSTVLLQHEVPDQFRGRVFSAELGLVTLTMSLATLAYGWLADVAGLELRTLIIILALSTFIPGTAWILAWRREPGPEAENA